MSRPIHIDQMVRQFKMRHTTSHLFKIDNFSLFKKHAIDKVESSVFDLAGHKWKLSVYPNGHPKAKGHVSMFLWNQVSVNVDLEYELFVVSQRERVWHSNGNVWFDRSSEPTCEGDYEFISLPDLTRNGYLIEDCCMLGVKFHNIAPTAKSGTAECFSLIEKPPNHKVTWMMTKFSSFDPKTAHSSNEYVVGTRKWRTKVYPRGCWEEKDKSFSVYLSAEGFINNVPNTKTYAKYKLRVLDQDDTRNHVEKTCSKWFGEKPDEQLGFRAFMPLGKLNEPYLVKDKLYVGVEFEVISTTSYC